MAIFNSYQSNLNKKLFAYVRHIVKLDSFKSKNDMLPQIIESLAYVTYFWFHIAYSF